MIVFSTIKTLFFFITFLFLIIATCFGIGGLIYVQDDWGEAISLWMSYFLYTYKLALGDFGDFFNIISNDSGSIKSKAIYVYFFITTIILTIILLNLLITILGEAYGKVKEKEMNHINSALLSNVSEIDSNYKHVELSASNGSFNLGRRLIYYIKFLIYSVFLNKILVRARTYGTYMIIADANDSLRWKKYLDIKTINNYDFANVKFLRDQS